MSGAPSLVVAVPNESRNRIVVGTLNAVAPGGCVAP